MPCFCLHGPKTFNSGLTGLMWYMSTSINRPDIGWHDYQFGLRWQIACSESWMWSTHIRHTASEAFEKKGFRERRLTGTEQKLSLAILCQRVAKGLLYIVIYWHRFLPVRRNVRIHKVIPLNWRTVLNSLRPLVNLNIKVLMILWNYWV